MDIEELQEISVIDQDRDEFLEKRIVWPAGKSGGIMYAEDIFDREFCQGIIDYCLNNTENCSSGRTLSGVMPHIKSSVDWRFNSQYTFPSNMEEEYDFRLRSQISKLATMYRDSFMNLQHRSSFDRFAIADSGYQVQKYEKNVGYYSEHIDGASWVRPDRTLGVVIYLNDVTIGGGTQFPVQNITIEAVTGRVAMFPAHWLYPHSGLMPISGDKWIISTFIIGELDVPNIQCH